jgi:TPP-dependent pyruvate/acetoin dehydrogenase alpha subunit
MQLSRDELIRAYCDMRTIRAFEDRVQEEFAAGNIPASFINTPARKPRQLGCACT